MHPCHLKSGLPLQAPPHPFTFFNSLDTRKTCFYFHLTDLVTVFDAILMSRQTREKLQCLYENLILNNFHKMAVLKKNMICKLKLCS